MAFAPTKRSSSRDGSWRWNTAESPHARTTHRRAYLADSPTRERWRSKAPYIDFIRDFHASRTGRSRSACRTSRVSVDQLLGSNSCVRARSVPLSPAHSQHIQRSPSLERNSRQRNRSPLSVPVYRTPSRGSEGSHSPIPFRSRASLPSPAKKLRPPFRCGASTTTEPKAGHRWPARGGKATSISPSGDPGRISSEFQILFENVWASTQHKNAERKGILLQGERDPRTSDEELSVRSGDITDGLWPSEPMEEQTPRAEHLQTEQATAVPDTEDRGKHRAEELPWHGGAANRGSNPEELSLLRYVINQAARGGVDAASSPALHRILRVLAKSAAEQPCQGESGGCKTASLEERPDDSSCSSTGQTPDAAAQPNQVLFVTHTNTLYDVASNEHLDPGMDHSLCSSHAPPLPRAAASVMESGEKNVEAVPIFDCETQEFLALMAQRLKSQGKWPDTVEVAVQCDDVTRGGTPDHGGWVQCPSCMTSWESGRQPRPAPKAGAKPTGTGGLGSIGEAANPAVPRGVLQAAQTDLVDAAVDRAAPPAAPTAPLRGGAPSSVAQSAEKSCARKFAPVRASEALSDRQKPIGKSAASALLQAISWAVDRHKEISCLPPSAVTDTDELSDGGSRDTVHGERRSTQWSVDDAGDTGLPRRLAAVHGESRLGDAQDLTNTSRERGPGHDPSARASVRRNDKTEPSFPGPQTYPRTLADGPDDGLEVSRGQGTERVATAPGEPEEPQAGGRSCPLPPVPQSQQPHQQKLFADPEGQDRRGAVETPLPASPSAARSQGGMRQPQPYAGPAVPEQSRGAPDAVSVEGGAKHKEIGPGNQESAAPRAKPHEVTGTDEEGEKLRSNIIRALKPLVVQNMEKFLSEGQPEGTPDAPAVEISVFAQGQKTCAADSEQNSKISDKEALPGIQSVSSLLTTQMVMQAKGINGAGRAYGTTDAQPMSWAADDPISLSANMEAFDKARGMMGSLKARGAEKAWLESGGAQGFASLGHDAVRTIAACCASHQSVDDRAAALEDGGYAAWREDTRSSAEESEGRASSGSNVAPGPVEARDQSFESCIESPARGDLDTTARQKAAVFAMSDLSQIGISSVTQTFSADLDSASQLELDADVGTSRTRASRHTDSTADRELASDLERQSSPELIKPGCEHDATQDQRDCDDPHAESRRGFSVPTPRPCTSPARGGSSAKSQKPTGTERGPGSKTQTRDGEGNGAGVALADRSLAWLSARSVEFLANISQISRCSIDGSDSRPLRGNIGASQDNQIDGSRIHFLPASIDLHDTAAEGQKEKDSAIQQEDSGSFFSSANTSGAHDLHWTRRADDSSTERCWYEHMEEWYGLKLRSASSPAIGCRTSDSFRVEVLRNSIGHIPLNAAELPSPFSLSAARRYKDAATPLDVDGCHPELVQCVDGGLSPRISGVVPLGMGMAKGLSAGDDRARAPARLRQSRGRKLDSSSSDLRQRAEAICNGMVCAVIGCVVASGALGSMDKKLQDANDEGAGQSSDDSLTRIGSMVDADSSGAMNESASYVSAPHPQPSAVWLNEPRQDEEARTSAEHGMPRSGPASPNVPLAEIVMTEFGSGGVASLSLPLPFEFDQPIPAWIPPPPHLSLGGQAWDTFNSGHVPLASAHSHSVSVPYDFPGADFVPGLPYDDDSPTASCNQSDPIHTSGGQGAGGLTGSKPLRKDSPYRRLKRFFSGALSSPGSNKDAGGNPPRKGQHRKSR